MAMRLLLADAHVVVCQGVRRLLEQAGMVVIGEAADGTEALRLAQTHQPQTPPRHPGSSALLVKRGSVCRIPGRPGASSG